MTLWCLYYYECVHNRILIHGCTHPWSCTVFKEAQHNSSNLWLTTFPPRNCEQTKVPASSRTCLYARPWPWTNGHTAKCKVREFFFSGHVFLLAHTHTRHVALTLSQTNDTKIHRSHTSKRTWNNHAAQKHDPSLSTSVFGRHKAGDSWQIQAEYPYQRKNIYIYA